jgi:hypothetical protein
MRLSPSVLKLMARGGLVGLVSLGSGCPNTSPSAPPAATPAAPTSEQPASQPSGEPTPEPAAEECDGNHTGDDFCSACGYCPPCGMG